MIRPERLATNTSSIIREDSAISEVTQSQQNPSFLYHESARSIVFRDAIGQRTAADSYTNSDIGTSDPPGTSYSYRRASSSFLSYYSSDISETLSVVDPLPKLPLRKHYEFLPLISSLSSAQDVSCFTQRQRHVVSLLENQTAVVKTVKNSEWSSFLSKFVTEHSFRTSTSLLPPNGQKMRCFGSTKEYTVSVVFALPTVGETSDAVYATDKEEQDGIERSRTWCWPSGYAAKTEFNVDRRGNLINGRKEALLPIQTMREYNISYLRDSDYVIGGRLIVGGLSTVPYNEIMLRVGRSTILLDQEVEGLQRQAAHWKGSYEDGLGYPVALFVRTAQYCDLVALLRTRARVLSVLGESEYLSNLPLLLITPEQGVKVITEEMQLELYQSMARTLNPFQNTTLHKTELDNSSADHIRQRIEELIDLNQSDIRSVLTRQECARIAGGFGATDESLLRLLMEAFIEDQRYKSNNNNEGKTRLYSGVEDDFSGLEGFDSGGSKANNEEISHGRHGHELEDVVNEGLVSAVRAGDYHASRQLLILHTLVASQGQRDAHQCCIDNCENMGDNAASILKSFLTFKEPNRIGRNSGYSSDASERSSQSSGSRKSGVSNTDYSESHARITSIMLLDTSLEMVAVEKENHLLPCASRPPPLDTTQLRSATNVDGLLVVLGAAHILKSIQDDSVRQRAAESIEAVNEWVENGEHSVAFRLSSWNTQRYAQADLKIAMEHDTRFTSFIGNHAIDNRKKFTAFLQTAVAMLDISDISFLRALHDMLSQMHSPCLRLELLQYILGLDNRYSVHHLTRCVELAVTCLRISTLSSHQRERENVEKKFM